MPKMTQERNPGDPRGEKANRIKMLGLQEQESDWAPGVLKQAREAPSHLMFSTSNTTPCKIFIPLYQIRDAWQHKRSAKCHHSWSQLLPHGPRLLLVFQVIRLVGWTGWGDGRATMQVRSFFMLLCLHPIDRHRTARDITRREIKQPFS